MPPEKIERRSILITIASGAAYGSLGIIISLFSKSGAVFLDGLFSLVATAAAGLTLYVSILVLRPRNEQYPLGYAAYEPMLNLFKGSLMSFALLYAIWSALRALLTGGTEISAVGGIIYALIATVGGIAVLYILKRMFQQSKSPIIEVDIKNWTVDTMISASVGIAFVATLILQNSQWERWAPYSDPLIMLAICLIAAPQPIQIIRNNWGQLTGRSASPRKKAHVGELVEEALADVPHRETHIRITEIGRYLYIHIYVIVPRETRQNIDVRIHDYIRARIYNSISKHYRYLALDIGFTMDVRWARSSVSYQEQETVYTSGQSSDSARSDGMEQTPDLN